MKSGLHRRPRRALHLSVRAGGHAPPSERRIHSDPRARVHRALAMERSAGVGETGPRGEEIGHERPTRVPRLPPRSGDGASLLWDVPHLLNAPAGSVAMRPADPLRRAGECGLQGRSPDALRTRSTVEAETPAALATSRGRLSSHGPDVRPLKRSLQRNRSCPRRSVLCKPRSRAWGGDR
ncbi:hypothetical protein Rumeso_01423 [Rubellimicrobium mesophilum DSM 19309]|uniref:Uncharacterized protein n=1 Tax=Rubellimicrobium mesophilum DSM 19309 TaxID=442562 RepID=A0A017HRA1_9RHOB|nr:hypothetical protein Rumeso_01423 [Rubellimicrobium mesophilum DSM 19309]